MRAFVHCSLALAVLLASTTLPVLAQGIGTVAGRVSDEQGVSLEGVSVTIKGPGMLGTTHAVTDAEGRFIATGVTSHHPLTIRAETAGRVPVEYVGHLARRDGVLRVDFTLRRPGEHDILALVTAGVPYHQTALDGARSTMPGRVSTMVVSDDSPTTARLLAIALEIRPSAVLAVGETAARLARRYIRDVPVVHVMVPAPEDAGLESANMCGVPLNGGFEAQLEHLRHVAPEATRLGTIYPAGRMDRCLRDLRRAAGAAGIEVTAVGVHANDAESVEEALRDLEGAALDAFMVLMEPGLVDAASFERIAAFARQREVILAVPDPSLALGESSFSFTPGFWEMGAFAGSLIRRIVEGRVEPSEIGMVFPERAALDLSGMERQDPRELLTGGGPK